MSEEKKDTSTGKCCFGIIIVIIIFSFAFAFFSGDGNDNVNLITITPSLEDGGFSQITELKDKNHPDIGFTVVNSEDNEVYYLTSEQVQKLYDYNDGNYSKSFKVNYKEDLYMMNAHARFVTDVFDMEGNKL